MEEAQSTGKWFIANDRGDEVAGTRGDSKDEATEALCIQLNMLHGSNFDWSYWCKRGYKIRKD